jgi:O-antigen biosynthesis rhamnosyltransferase
MLRLSVLHITREFPEVVSGGIEQSILLAAKTMSDVSHSVLCLGGGVQPERTHVESVRIWRVLPFVSAKYLPVSVRWFLLFRRLARRVDVVHVHSPFPLGELTSLFTDKPVVCTYHADIDGFGVVGAVYRWIQRSWLKRQQMIVASSAQYIASSKTLSAIQHKCRVLPFGVTDDTVEPTRPPEDFPDRFFLFVGSLRRYKGIEILIQAASESGLPVVIAGDGERRHLVEQIDPPVFWLGQVSDAQKAWLINHSTALILPSTSRAEAFGIVLLEAMRAGKPAICTSIGTATDWIVEHRSTGVVVPPMRADTLAAIMVELWEDDILRRQMGQAGRARFVDVFEGKRYSAGLFDIYREVIRR